MSSPPSISRWPGGSPAATPSTPTTAERYPTNAPKALTPEMIKALEEEKRLAADRAAAEEKAKSAKLATAARAPPQIAAKEAVRLHSPVCCSLLILFA